VDRRFGGSGGSSRKRRKGRGWVGGRGRDEEVKPMASQRRRGKSNKLKHAGRVEADECGGEETKLVAALSGKREGTQNKSAEKPLRGGLLRRHVKPVRRTGKGRSFAPATLRRDRQPVGEVGGRQEN